MLCFGVTFGGLPLAALGPSSCAVGGLSGFFFFTTVVLFLSNVMGLNCGRLLNFFSNSSSSFPRLTGVEKKKTSH